MKLHFPFVLASRIAALSFQEQGDIEGNGLTDYCNDENAGVNHCLSLKYEWTAFNGPATHKQTTAPESSGFVSSTLRSVRRAKRITSLKAASTSGASTSSLSTMTSSRGTTSSKPSTSASTISGSTISTALLPPPSTFASQNNTKWNISRIGYIYSSSIPSLTWDKGRTSILSNTTFWNFGDVLSKDGLQNGFSMGAAFYASKNNILEVDTKDIKNVKDWDFAKPWAGDPAPRNGTTFWGMDTSNVVEVMPGVGLGFVWEIWRSTKGQFVDRGSGMIKVTLGPKVPVANRTGPLITGPDSLQVGLMTVLKAEGYIYVYSNGESNFIVGRAKIGDAFDATKYEFRKRSSGEWVVGIPKTNDTSYGVQGSIWSNGQGSIMYSNYLKKYMLFTGAYGYHMNFYTSDTPYGPWSTRYVLTVNCGYGINVHPEFSPGGDHRILYISSGAADGITMYRVEFKY